jgi:hypothetical protein
MKNDEIVDYAMPLIQIEKLAKEIHQLCLSHEYEKARLKAESLCVEGRLLQHTLSIMEENKR